MSFFDQLWDAADLEPSADPTGGDVGLADSAQVVDASNALALHGDALLLGPGAASSLAQCMALPDPLLGIADYRFEAFTLAPNDPLLVDLDGDGVPDATRWGTPVVEIDGYTRADGTPVESHYRTVADGVGWNNLNRWR